MSFANCKAFSFNMSPSIGIPWESFILNQNRRLSFTSWLRHFRDFFLFTDYPWDWHSSVFFLPFRILESVVLFKPKLKASFAIQTLPDLFISASKPSNIFCLSWSENDSLFRDEAIKIFCRLEQQSAKLSVHFSEFSTYTVWHKYYRSGFFCKYCAFVRWKLYR